MFNSMYRRVATALVATAVAAATAVGIPAAAYAASVPTLLGSNQASSAGSVTLPLSSAANGNVVLVWESKEGQSATPVQPTLSFNSGSCTTGSDTRHVFDDSGATRAQLGVFVLSSCSSANGFVLTFSGQTQTHIGVIALQVGTNDTVSTPQYGGSANNVTDGIAATLPDYTSSDVAVTVGAHEANETTVTSAFYDVVQGGVHTSQEVDSHGLDSVYGPGNGSIAVGYQTFADAPVNASVQDAFSSGAHWTTAAPGGVAAFVVS
ncbi:MAG TPA: hypothetical protein VLA88_00725 [Candidatus Saccharimonadales bacterium]|nr:hypothetical protein [Candidatus Saccharimonadales bacterium]